MLNMAFVHGTKVDVSSLFDVVVATQINCFNNKCYFDMISDLMVHIPTVAEKVNDKSPFPGIKVFVMVHCTIYIYI